MAGLTPIPPSMVPIADNRPMNGSWYQFFVSLFNLVKSISNGVLTYSVSSNLTATGASQATALLLTSDWNQFSTVALNTGCRLADAVGQSQLVTNNGANALRVYPPTGSQIDALGLNNPYSLPADKTQVFSQFTATSYKSMQLG